MDNDFQLVLLTNILGALATHEWLKRYDPPSFGGVVSALATIPFAPLYFASGRFTDLSSVLVPAALSYTLFYVALLLFVVRYRLSSGHPLAQYPGPTIMKMTKLWGTWIAYRGRTHTYLKELHNKYGPTIRIGPNEVSTVEKALIPLILGNQGMPKGPPWDGRRFGQTGKGYDSLIDLRDSVLHAQLRKPWNKSFFAEPLNDYEGFLIVRVRQLNSHLEDLCSDGSRATGGVDIAKWLNSFSFDFLGDIAFGGCFQLMREEDRNGHFECMTDGLYLISITQHLPWIAPLTRRLPIINNTIKKFIEFGVEHAIKRSSMEVKRKDLFSYMSEASESGSTEPDLPMIISNVLLAIVAGSDTTSSAISNAIYLLLSNPKTYKRLKEEVQEVFEINEILRMDEDISSDSPDRYSQVLAGMGYLNAVINETLRLFPVVPTGLQRAPAKGSAGRLLQTDSITMFLPEGNAITVAPWVIHRDPRYFSPHPDAFIPERWLSDGDGSGKYVTSRDAFIPFSSGPQSCVGRPLAQMEMRYVLATLMWNFDMEFDTPTYDPSSWERDMEDRFTLLKGSLQVRISRTSKRRDL